MSKSRNILPPRKPWSLMELTLLRANYADSHTSDIGQALGRNVGAVHRKANKLGLRKSREQIAAMARAAILNPDHAGRARCFKKGGVPANKGLKHRPGWAPGNMASTQFKPGNAPPTTLPLGSYRVNPDGYVEVKLTELPGPYTMRWKPVHRLVWEAANGPIPKGHVVAFKPGRVSTDPAAITLDAIELLTFAQNLARNSIHNLPKPLVAVIRLRGVLNRQINHRSKQA